MTEENRVCSSCLAGPGQGHDPDCNADRRPRERGVLICKCDYSAMLRAELAKRDAVVEAAESWSTAELRNLAKQGSPDGMAAEIELSAAKRDLRKALSALQSPAEPDVALICTCGHRSTVHLGTIGPCQMLECDCKQVRIVAVTNVEPAPQVEAVKRALVMPASEVFVSVSPTSGCPDEVGTLPDNFEIAKGYVVYRYTLASVDPVNIREPEGGG